jgi:methylase of polypeptide subunit release factors
MTFGKDGAAMLRAYTHGDEDAAVAFLRSWAGEGPALELGIGTGRIALPLAATGIRVDGIDISPHVVELLRAQPGGNAIDVTIGDFRRRARRRRVPADLLPRQQLLQPADAG